MQNRTNRNLLFGPRASAAAELPATAQEADALELENQRAVDALRGSAGSIKDIALHIDADVSDQNRILDRMDKRFDNANSLLAQTSHLLHEMVSDRTSSRMCALIGTIFLALLILYYFFKH